MFYFLIKAHSTQKSKYRPKW